MTKIKIVLLLLVFILTQRTTFSQEQKQGFDVNKMFIGGNLILGYGGGNNNSQFTIGANPEIGYSVFKRVDFGFCFNVINQSGNYSDYYNSINYNVKYNSFQFGVGVFTRIHVTDGVFIQAQPEFNNIKIKGSTDNASIILKEETLHSSSFLVGVGYGTHDIGNANFFTSILVDLQNNLHSPYRNSAGQIVPQIRGGMNWYLGRKKKK